MSAHLILRVYYDGGTFVSQFGFVVEGTIHRYR